MTDGDSIEDRLDDLDDLIRWLEAEKDRLKKGVEKAAAEWEFDEANALAKSYNQIVGRLRALKNLRDPGFDQREHHYRHLVYLEEQSKAHSEFPELAAHYKDQLKKVNQALDKLEQANHTLIDTQHIDDAIFQLVEGKIENLRLHLNKDQKLVFDFTCPDRILRIGFSYKKKALFASMKKKLRRIGFAKIDGERKFVRSVDVSNFKDAQVIKKILAVVVFDVFGRSWFDNPAILEINHHDDQSKDTPHRTGK